MSSVDVSVLRDVTIGLTERKRGVHSNDEIRKAVVSFANSVPEGRTAVLFIGVANDGAVMGIPADQVEKVQQQVRRICEEDCFPAIAIQLASALAIDGKHVVAFEFGPSRNRPHFAGHAYVRVGAESVKASASKLDELIAAKNTKAGRLLSAKDAYEQSTSPWSFPLEPASRGIPRLPTGASGSAPWKPAMLIRFGSTSSPRNGPGSFPWSSWYSAATRTGLACWSSTP